MKEAARAESQSEPHGPRSGVAFLLVSMLRSILWLCCPTATGALLSDVGVECDATTKLQPVVPDGSDTNSEASGASPPAQADAVVDAQKAAEKVAEEKAAEEKLEAEKATAKKEERPAEMLGRYVDIASIEEFALSGDICLVWASYFLELAAAGRKIPAAGRFLRRQDLPQRAVVDHAAVRRLAAEVREWRAFLAKLLAAQPDKAFVAYAMRFSPFVVASYAWLSPEHSDPDSRQLREVLAPAIEWYMSERARLADGNDDYAQHGAPTPCLADGIDFAIFVDFSGLWQKERDEEQDASFGRALSAMDLLYAHQETSVWRMTRLLDGYDTLPYAERGVARQS